MYIQVLDIIRLIYLFLYISIPSVGNANRILEQIAHEKYMVLAYIYLSYYMPIAEGLLCRHSHLFIFLSSFIKCYPGKFKRVSKIC